MWGFASFPFNYSSLIVNTFVQYCVDRYIHTYIHTCIHAYIHTYIHTYIHAYIHTYIHTYIYTYIMHTYMTFIQLKKRIYNFTHIQLTTALLQSSFIDLQWNADTEPQVVYSSTTRWRLNLLLWYGRSASRFVCTICGTVIQLGLSLFWSWFRPTALI